VAKPKRIPHLRKPEEMSLEEWQVALRRQFAREQKFRVKNLGAEPVFSEFHVTNPQSGKTYRVAIRGERLGDNYCSCPDFATNTLGTCKHVEFTLAKVRRQRGAKAALANGFQPPYSEVYLRYGAKREVIFGPGAACPAALKKLASEYFDAGGILRPEAYGQFHVFLKTAAGGGHEVRCYDDALAFIAQVRDRADLARRIAKAFPDGGRALDHLLKVPLYPFQEEGALFAARAGRCLIADDMGLGKTIQAIAGTEILARAAGIERVLVISPTSLKHQWQREIEKFTGRTAVVVEGMLTRRAAIYSSESFYKITNCDVVYRDREAIARWRPDLIILDEAQRIKNWKTRTAQAVKDLESPYAFVLTGTPLENRLEELYSIVEFVDRFRMGPMFRFLGEHQHVDDHGKVIGYRNLSKISETLAPILVRRTKEKVLKELPERLEKRFFVPMTPQQMTHHEENREIVARIVAKWRRYGFLSETDQRRLQCALQNMRMACNSTYLLDGETDHGVKADEVATLLAEVMEEPQIKVVLFSQWVRMHELITRRLAARRWRHVFFHGGVPGPQRKHLVDRFREDDDCRLFLSTDAGGVGLNLQNASVVVNMDQPWNPAVLEQRIGRVHRLGQHRPVRVVHFISQGTIEEGMLGLLAFKRSMFTGVLDGGQDEVFLGGTRLTRFMDSVEKAAASVPPSMPAEPEPVETEKRTSAPEAPQQPNPHPRGPVEEPAAPERIWQDIVTAGVSFLDKLGQALATAGNAPPDATGGDSAASAFIGRNTRTGQPCLQLPLPAPETLQRISDVLAALARNR
jgi:superfamily II DNA or RNA helicase